MSITQFAMVEELASLVKDNLPSKHLILSIEDALINFLEDDTRSDEALVLQPMNPYNRLLVHRLAEIFGFSHQSVGEGENRHLVLERSPETSMPTILVRDLLLEFDEIQSPMGYGVLRRTDFVPAQRYYSANELSLEAREHAYMAARERIFSPDVFEGKLMKDRPKTDPVVAHRMIAHALGQKNKTKDEVGLVDAKDYGRFAKDLTLESTSEMDADSIEHERPFAMPKALNVTSNTTKARNNSTLDAGNSTAVQKANKIREVYSTKEHIGAAKRLFANALGVQRRDAHQSKS